MRDTGERQERGGDEGLRPVRKTRGVQTRLIHKLWQQAHTSKKRSRRGIVGEKRFQNPAEKQKRWGGGTRWGR